MTEGILVSVTLKQLFEDNDYSTKLNATERRAWEAIEKVCRSILKTKTPKITEKMCRR